MKTIFCVGTLALASWVFAFEPVPNSTIQTKKSDSILVQCTPPKKHHFNLKAPNEIRETSQSFNPTTMSREKMEFLIPLSKTDQKVRKMEARLFVCDVAEKYCVPQKINFDVNE